MRVTRVAVRAAAGVALLCAGVVAAVEHVALEVARIDGGSWTARDLTISAGLTSGAPTVKLRITEASLPGLQQSLRNVTVQCTALEISKDFYRCRRATVQFTAPHLTRQSLTADVRYGRSSRTLDIDLKGLRVGRGSAAAFLAFRSNEWSARVSLEDADVGKLSAIAEAYGGLRAPLEFAAGKLVLSARLSGGAGGLHQASLRGRVSGLTGNNASGSIASDKLSLNLSADLTRTGGAAWRFALDVRSHQGQGYFEPIFLDFAARAAVLTARGVWRSDKLLTLEEFTVDHADAIQVRGGAVLDFRLAQPLRTLDAELAAVRFPGAYESYAQPWLLDTSFKALQTEGAVSGRVHWADGAPRSIDLTLERVAFDDGAQRLAVRGLEGRVRWRSGDDAETENEGAETTSAQTQSSMLRWSGGTLLGLEIGAARISFHSAERAFRLLEPARIPVLDGAVELETFRVRSAGTPQAAFLVDARLQPISVARLCQAFGWPEFGGELSGEISKLRMREGVITLGATLHARVFDGAISISDLRLEEPFGQWPKLESTVTLDRLDLELVTRAFSFGRITGRLSGAVAGLQLFNWTPVAFDARFFTPPNDRSRRRISQRAVENIGALGGGGATAALSSGFLRFFDDFNYDRLGLSCRLRNEVCEMGGAGPAPNGGYYLVKGQGLPRIDVIGNARRVDWPRLVQQLIAITKSEGPVVQ